MLHIGTFSVDWVLLTWVVVGVIALFGLLSLRDLIFMIIDSKSPGVKLAITLISGAILYWFFFLK